MNLKKNGYIYFPFHFAFKDNYSTRMIRYYYSSTSEKCIILSNYLFVYVYHAETGQCQ